MKKRSKLFLSTIMAATLMSSFVACGRSSEVDVTTELSKTDSSSSNSNANSSLDKNITYVYGYAPLSYAQYWSGELGKSVETLEQSSDKKDSEGMYDAGMYDSVSRATTKHGIYYQQFQYTVEVTGEKITSSETVTENGKEKTKYTTDSNDIKTITVQAAFDGIDSKGSIITKPIDNSVVFKNGSSTFTIGEGNSAIEYKVTNYKVLGYSKIPVAIPSDLVEKAKENGFVEDSSVSSNTYGLKVMNTDGNYKARQSSGTVNSETTIVADKDNIKYGYNTRYGSDAEAYIYLKNKNGDELTKDEFLKYSTNFLTAKYEYYGKDSTYNNLVATYGTKNSSDTWWSTNHGNRIDCAINYNFDRFKGSGSGYYKITLIANGYEDIVAYVCFQDPYPNKVTGTIKNNTFTFSGINKDELKNSKITITSGFGRNTKTIVKEDNISELTYKIPTTLEVGTEYNVSITVDGYQPLTFKIIAE